MERKWTAEPWREEDFGTQPASDFKQVRTRDFARAATCVNSLQGIADPAEALKAAREALMEALDACDPRAVRPNTASAAISRALTLLTPTGEKR